MKYEIENRVSKSPLKTIDIEDFIVNSKIEIFDIKNWLKDEFILIEKDFRKKVISFDWSIYKKVFVSIQCTNNAIVPHWAFLLISSELKKLNIKNFIGSISDFENYLINEAINLMDLSAYHNKSVIIKGCSNKVFKESFYSILIDKLQPVVKSIMFGEACSSVPIYKKRND